MPNQTSNQSDMRADGHWMRVYLSPLIGTLVWSGTISSTPAAANALNLAVTGTSGAHTAVKRGMRVVIKTPSGGTKGTLTVRHAGTLSSGNLPAREFSRGHIEVEAGDTFEVWNDFQLVDRLVAANEAFDPDGEVYTDQNSLLAPVGTSGGPWAGWVDEGETFATVPLTGAAYIVDEDSADTVTYVTTLPSGCSFAAGSTNTDASPTIEADVGYHVIERTFTDASNSKSETQYVLIIVHDADNPPYDLPDELTVAGERGRGFGLNGVRLFENAALADLPDRAPVIVWCDERIGGAAQSIGMKAAGRSHILCVGYLRRDTGKIDGKGNELRFDIIAPLQRLSELPGFSKVMMREASPDTWSEVEGLSVKRAIIQLLRHYTNALQLWDVTFDGFSDTAYSTFFLQKQVPFEQVRELADARDGSLSADASGRLELQQLLEFTPLGDRAGVTETITLGLDDILIDPAEGLHVEIVRDHERPVEIFRTRGFTAGTDITQNTPLFGKWAASPGTGTSSSTVERMIADDATSFLARTALRGAWEDRIYTNADGEQFHAPEVKVTLPGSYRGIFQFYREYVRLDLDETTNPRGIDLREFLFIVTTVEVQVRQGTARVVLTLRAATYAEGGVEDPAEALVSSLPDLPYIDVPSVQLPGDDFILGSGTHNLGFIDSNGYLYLADTRPTLPVWSRVSLAGLGMAGTAVMYIVDAFDFANGAHHVNESIQGDEHRIRQPRAQ
ncbi:MAG: hypothetical protein IPK17_38470 [Chloroflexi bacterium]|uniref:hypothetical protein n=1 Tax=Candidatus Flexifilum breve TaxID=3140694 RepID=UPI0031372CEC|nr:hypothetical protein [Chloroflexota bacterium]